MKKIRVSLSKSELNNLLEKVENLKSDLPKCDENIQNSLADYTKAQIEHNLSATPFKDGNDDVSTFKENISGKIIVGMEGKQAIYDEFGTGSEGQRSPHPLKNEYSLQDYNSGKKIRTASEIVNDISGIPIGEKYWTYKNAQGEIIYTTGIPAGKQVFDASQALKSKKKEIIKKEVGDVLSKL